jgi:hypothetical protein
VASCSGSGSEGGFPCGGSGGNHGVGSFHPVTTAAVDVLDVFNIVLFFNVVDVFMCFWMLLMFLDANY